MGLSGMTFLAAAEQTAMEGRKMGLNIKNREAHLITEELSKLARA
jgi:hypothetical protein